jgi:hypothetical protein
MSKVKVSVPLRLVDDVQQRLSCSESPGVLDDERVAGWFEIGAVGGSVRRQQRVWRRPQRMICWQRLDLIDIEAGARDDAIAQRTIEIVEPRRHSAPDIDEERRCFHAAKAAGIEQPFCSGCVRHGQNHEVRKRKKSIELVWRMQLAHAFGHVRFPWIDADDAHAEGRTEPRGSSADAANADDERKRAWKMHDRGWMIAIPLARALAIHVNVKPARKREHIRHDVRRNAIGEDSPQVRHRQGVRDELGMVVPGRRRCLG